MLPSTIVYNSNMDQSRLLSKQDCVRGEEYELGKGHLKASPCCAENTHLNRKSKQSCIGRPVLFIDPVFVLECEGNMEMQSGQEPLEDLQGRLGCKDSLAGSDIRHSPVILLGRKHSVMVSNRMEPLCWEQHTVVLPQSKEHQDVAAKVQTGFLPQLLGDNQRTKLCLSTLASLTPLLQDCCQDDRVDVLTTVTGKCSTGSCIVDESGTDRVQGEMYVGSGNAYWSTAMEGKPLLEKILSMTSPTCLSSSNSISLLHDSDEKAITAGKHPVVSHCEEGRKVEGSASPMCLSSSDSVNLQQDANQKRHGCCEYPANGPKSSSVPKVGELTCWSKDMAAVGSPKRLPISCSKPRVWDKLFSCFRGQPEEMKREPVRKKGPDCDIFDGVLPPDRAMLLPYLRAHGAHALAYSTLQCEGPLRHYVVPGLGYLAYAWAPGFPRVSVVMGDPIAETSQWDMLVARFLRDHPRTTFVQVSEEFARMLSHLGFLVNSFGGETDIHIPAYSYSRVCARKKDGLRQPIDRARRAGVVVQELQMSSSEGEAGEKLQATFGIFQELRAISEEWCRYRGPVAATTWFISRQPAYEAEFEGCRTFVSRDASGCLTGFLVFDPRWSGGRVVGYLANVIRIARSAHPGTQGLIIQEAMKVFRAEQIPWLSLGLTPLARLEDAPRRGFKHSAILAQALAYVAERGNSWYPYKNIAQSKARYGGGWDESGQYRDPAVQWQPRFIAHRMMIPGLELHNLSRLWRTDPGFWYNMRMFLRPSEQSKQCFVEKEQQQQQQQPKQQDQLQSPQQQQQPQKRWQKDGEQEQQRQQQPKLEEQQQQQQQQQPPQQQQSDLELQKIEKKQRKQLRRQQRRLQQQGLQQQSENQQEESGQEQQQAPQSSS